MPVSALVVTLADGPRGDDAAAELARHPALTLGPRYQAHLPVVAETRTLAEGEHLVRDHIPAVAGVVLVSVVAVDFSDVDAEALARTPGASSRCRSTHMRESRNG
jgi:hypothetical protein